MTIPPACPECGASWADGLTCTDHYHQMLFWELDHGLPDVHHLLVLCYHLQHPALYSSQGLDGAKQLLVAFVEEGVTPQAMRERIGPAVDSGKRDYRITAHSEAQGGYRHPVVWERVAADVVHAGIDRYYASVRQWAEATLRVLYESGNLRAEI